MQFSVIYSVDCCRSASVRQFAPPKVRHLWQLTERDDQYDLDHLGGDWRKGKHRKWAGLLTQDQFESFVSHTGLFAEDVRTLGSLGAPGCGLGLAPAISFRGDAYDAEQNAYVTPLGSKSEIVAFLQQHEVSVPSILLDSDDQQYLFPKTVDREAPWEAVRQAMIEAYS